MFHFDRDFVDKNSERYMFPVRIKSLARDLLDKHVLISELLTGDFMYAEGDYTYAQMEQQAQWRSFSAGSETWGEPDQFVWFRQTVTIPETFKGQDVWYMAFPYTQSDVWPWGQPQIQMFVNGKCVCGLDNNHRRHLLVKNAVGGEVLDICLKAYSDLKYYRGKMTMRAQLQIFRPKVYELYQSIMVPLRAASLMSSDSIERVEIVKTLNKALTMLKLEAQPGSEEFMDSAEEVARFLDEHLYGSMTGGMEPVLWAVGHSHIDVAWQWTYHITRNKTARTFATNLRLMEQNPDYKFMASQAQLYDFVKQDEPELYKQIKERVREGRWQPEGGMWVEADTNLTSGESLVRQFLVGKKFFREEFGVDNRILWLPDVFGYSGNLPQICRRSGIDYFYTTKIGWNEYDKFPYDTFRWRGLDGSTVLAHFGCAIDYKEIEKDWMTTYNPSFEPNFVLGAWKRYQQKDLNRDLLYDFGYGDGGGGPTQEMIDYGRRFEKGIPGCPRAKFAMPDEYFRKLEEDVSDNPHLPEWSGEMYLEFHRGTYTSQARVKKNNRRSEQMYHDVENLWSAACALSGDYSAYPTEKLEENWKLILLNQFHDVLPGSSIPQVYEDAGRHHEKVLREGEEMKNAAAQKIAACIHTDGESIAVFNTLSIERSPNVIYDGIIPGLRDEAGNYIPCQQTYDGKTVFTAPNVPAKGWKVFTFTQKVGCESPITAKEDLLENEYLRVSFDEKMHITSLYSKTADRETLPENVTGGRVIAYEDVCLKDDAWNVQAYYQEKSFVIDDVQSANIIENGPVRCVLRVTRRFRNSHLTTDIILYARGDELIFDYNVDWHEKNLFVKAEYPVDVNAKNATYDIQFGSVQRPVCKNTLWDFARFEVCGHKWADLSDGGFGLSIINDCKYGYDASRNCLRLSLLKCSTYPDPMQDQGQHSFSYAVYPHAGDEICSRVRDRAYDFNFKPTVVHIAAAQDGCLKSTNSVFSLDASNVVLETVKKAEEGDALILRMYEAENKRTRCTLSSALYISEAVECDLMERPEKMMQNGKNSLELTFRPFEIKTVRIKF